MNQSKKMVIIDEFGIINEAEKILNKEEFKLNFISAIAELEDNSCYITKNFPITRLHKVKGINKDIYRADIDKISGWRIHMQYSNEYANTLILKQIIEGQRHDDCIDTIKSHMHRYNTTFEKKSKKK